MKKKFNPIVTDEKRIAELDQEFEKNNEAIDKKVYNSLTDEKGRIIKVSQKQTINYPIEDVFRVMEIISINDMHPELMPENFVEGAYFISSGRTHNLPIKIVAADKKSLMEIMWFNAKGERFAKRIELIKLTDTKTKVKYTDIVKGFKTLFGLTDSHMRHLYVAKQELAFKMQMARCEMQLTDDPKTKEKLEKKIERLTKKQANKF